MVRLCFSLLLLRKEQYRIHMPRGLMDDLEGEVVGEEIHEGGFGDDIFAADADGIDVLLLNVGQHHASAVTDDLCRGIDVMGVGCISHPISVPALRFSEVRSKRSV